MTPPRVFTGQIFTALSHGTSENRRRCAGMKPPRKKRSEPAQPKRARSAKAGLKPGEGAAAEDHSEKSKQRPVAEEDVFGGAERTHVRKVKTSDAKP